MKTNFANRKSVVPFALVGVGVGMGLLLSTLGDAQSAMAQQDGIKPENILSAGAQRTQIIDKLSAIERRLGTLESKLNAPLSVKVLEMPAMKMADGK